MTNPTRLQARRRVLLVVAAVLVSLEVTGATMASAVMGRSIILRSVAATASVADEAPALEDDRMSVAGQGLPNEPPGFDDARVWRIRGVLIADLFYDRPSADADAGDAEAPQDEATLGAQPEGGLEVAVTEAPANAGPEATAAAGEPAGARLAAAVVAQRLRIPDLGINRTIQSFPCSRSEPPGDYVYRWGCAGRNNLYLLGHAASVFKPLHDAYATGRLRVGLSAYWTDSTGGIHQYKVTTWRVVQPDQTAWAIADQPVASMTLQTCYGANNEYRLLVRLVAVS